MMAMKVPLASVAVNVWPLPPVPLRQRYTAMPVVSVAFHTLPPTCVHVFDLESVMVGAVFGPNHAATTKKSEPEAVVVAAPVTAVCVLLVPLPDELEPSTM